jgi:hypothetical protein
MAVDVSSFLYLADKTITETSRGMLSEANQTGVKALKLFV